MTQERTPGEQIEAPEHAKAAIAQTPVPTQERLLALQQRVGNQAFGRMLDRWKADKAVLAREDIPSDAEIKEAEDWAAEGTKGSKDLTPGAGGSGLNNAPGGFDAEYDPKLGVLTVTMRCAVDFQDGIDKAGVAKKGLEKQLERINKIADPLERETQLGLFRWGEGEDAEDKVNYRSGVEAEVEPFWSNQHQFFMRKKGWSWLGATVTVDLKIENKSKMPDAHLTIKPIKVPDNVSLGAFVSPGQATNARDQEMSVTSNINASGSFLNHSVVFDIAKSEVRPDQTTKLQNVIDTFKGAETAPNSGVADARSLQTPVFLTGHASKTGNAAFNQKLSEDRARSVEKFMKEHGFVNTEVRTTEMGLGDTEASGGENEKDRRVDIQIGSGNSQNTLRHEFGHAFGLGDEYASTPLVSPGQTPAQGTPAMGDTATHDNLVKNMVDAGGTPLKGAVCEPTDSIMSVGDVVRPQHYATFHASLTKITAPHGPWALGAPTGKKDALPGSAGAAEPGLDAGTPVPGPVTDGEPVAV